MLFKAFSGEETFPGATCKVRLFYRRTAKAQELPVHIAQRDSGGGLRNISTEFLNACEGTDLRGKWINATFDIPDGAYMQMWMQRRGGGGFGFTTAKLLMRTREDAALRRVRVALTGHERAVCTAGYIEGRFDVITPEMFEAFGVATDQWSEHYDPVYAEGMYSIEVLEREVSELSVPSTRQVTTASGAVVSLAQKKGVRAIRMKRP